MASMPDLKQHYPKWNALEKEIVSGMLPPVSEDDAGKIMTVLGGKWVLSEPMPVGDYVAIVSEIEVEDPETLAPYSVHLYKIADGISCDGFAAASVVCIDADSMTQGIYDFSIVVSSMAADKTKTTQFSGITSDPSTAVSNEYPLANQYPYSPISFTGLNGSTSDLSKISNVKEVYLNNLVTGSGDLWFSAGKYRCTIIYKRKIPM